MKSEQRKATEGVILMFLYMVFITFAFLLFQHCN
jgi:hypothetical protein